MFKLVIEDDEGNKTVVPIVRDEITIGRREGNTIRLTERNVSRDHAKLTRRNGEVYVSALSARYGIKRNGDKIAGEEEFILGDVIEIGDYRLALQSDAVTEAKKPPAMPPAKVAPPPEAVRTQRRRAVEGTEIIDTDPARLVIVSSNFAGQEFPLARREMVIGRGEECDIIIDHRSVSQTHAKIVRESSGEYKIIDLKSKNGVKVGGEEYRAVHLKRGDIVDLGHVKFRFVESGENYIFTPQPEDDIVVTPSPNKGLIAGVLAALMVLSGIVVWYAVRDPAQPPIDIDTPALAVSNDTDAESSNNLDDKIDKAEQDYLAAKVQKAAGMLELLREDDPTPTQVARIDDLLSKTKREVGFVRNYENGLHHFQEERWLPALQELRQIPDDADLNIYRLVEQGRYIDQAVANATAEQLELAENATSNADRQAAVGRITELQAMFPSHVAPPEALAELADLTLAAVATPTVAPERTPPVTKTPKVTRVRPKRPKQTPPPAANVPETDARVIAAVAPKKPAGPSARELYDEAFAALMVNKFNTAKSKGHEAIKVGCRHECYRVIAMAHQKLGENAQACEWFAKAGLVPPEDLQCK